MDKAEANHQAGRTRAVRPLFGSSGIPVPAGGNFQGRRPTKGIRRVGTERASALGGLWSSASCYDRRARVCAIERLTTTGTFRLALQVTDGRDLEVVPGYFVGIEAHVGSSDIRRSPYCMVQPPGGSGPGRFDLLVRLVEDGPLSRHLCGLRAGDTIAFRGPKGRTMVPDARDRDLVVVATGVAVGPCASLAARLLNEGFGPRIDLFWGLRLATDIWPTPDLDALAARHPNFDYQVSLSAPPPDWTGLRGRVTESVPSRITALAGKRFYLVGNGRMISEMTAALSDVGVAARFIYCEPYFDARHRADPRVVAAIRDRFVAEDVFSPLAHRQAAGLDPTPHTGAMAHSQRTDPNSASDLIRGPDFLSQRRRPPTDRTSH